MPSNLLIDTNILIVLVALEWADSESISDATLLNIAKRFSILPGNAAERLDSETISKLRRFHWDDATVRATTPHVLGEIRAETYLRDHPIGVFRTFEIIRAWLSEGWLIEVARPCLEILSNERTKAVVTQLGVTDAALLLAGATNGFAVVSDDERLRTYCDAHSVESYDIQGIGALAY